MNTSDEAAADSPESTSELTDKAKTPNKSNTPERQEQSAADSHNREAAEPDILYCLEVNDERNARRSFYQDKPWDGVKGLIGPDSDATEKTGVVIVVHIEADVSGTLEEKGNTPQTWRDDPAGLELGHSKKFTNRFPPCIKLHSKNLIRVMESLLDYYPDHLGGYDLYHCNPDNEVVTEIMYYFPELKAYLRHFTEALNPKDNDLSVYDIGNCGDDDIKSLTAQHLDFGTLEPEKRPPSVEEARDIAVLLRLFAPMYRLKMVPLLSSFLLHPQQLIKFEDLWSFLRPGTRVYVQLSAFSDTKDFLQKKFYRKSAEDHGFSCCVVAKWEYVEKDVGPHGVWYKHVDHLSIRLWSIEYDGIVFQRISRDALVFRYPGYQAATALPVVPAYLYDQLKGGDISERLRRRGMKYLSILTGSPAHREYDDPQTGYHGQIILDPDAHRQFADNNLNAENFSSIFDGGGGSKFRDITNFQLSEFGKFGRIEEVYPLLPASICGFALKTKEWMTFKIDGISDGPPEYEENVLEDHLVLFPEADRLSLRTVLPIGESSNSKHFDFVSGKGEGKIFLLYGPPGTGKTLTVERLANSTQRPLLSWTAQDISAHGNPETCIKTWFALAAKWNAILLIDEADVFLEQRQEGAMGGNAAVTLFLRMMEYYKGVLFLMTNRPGHIDDSFISRITCPIAYSELSKQTKREIICKFVELIESDETIDFGDGARTYLTDNCDAFNGRELRNLLQNAVAAAEVKMRPADRTKKYVVKVNKEHIKAAMERQGVFRNYLKTLRNKDVDARARAKQDYLPTHNGASD